MKASNLSRAAGWVQQHIHCTFMELGHVSSVLVFCNPLLLPMYLTQMLRKFFPGAEKMGGGGLGLFTVNTL
jgi:hypothetical protein